MSKFVLNERVIYRGLRDDRRNTQATIVRVHPVEGKKQYYALRFDDGGLEAHTVAEKWLEPAINWHKPVELSDGTPLRLTYTGDFMTLMLNEPHPCQPGRGRLIDARKENGLVISNHKYHVRNKIMTTIDTTKPLEVDGFLADDVTFVTMTSDGHILVSLKGNGWVIFDTEGKFVRSDDGKGQALRLRNKVVRKTVYQRVVDGRVLGVDYDNATSARGLGGHAIVRVTSEDGVVIEVEFMP